MRLARLTGEVRSSETSYESLQTEAYAESLSFFPELREYNTGPESYLRHIEEAKKVLEDAQKEILLSCEEKYNR